VNLCWMTMPQLLLADTTHAVKDAPQDRKVLGLLVSSSVAAVSALEAVRMGRTNEAISVLEPKVWELAIAALKRQPSPFLSIDAEIRQVLVRDLVPYRRRFRSDSSRWSEYERELERLLDEMDPSITHASRASSRDNRSAEDYHVAALKTQCMTMVFAVANLRGKHPPDFFQDLESGTFSSLLLLYGAWNGALTLSDREQLLRFSPRVEEYRRRYRSISSEWTPAEKKLYLLTADRTEPSTKAGGAVRDAGR
jgi:hypothetical protein